MESEFADRLNKILEVKKPNSKYLSKVKYEKLILHLKELKTKKPKIPNDYRIIKKYDIVKMSNVERLVVPRANEDVEIKYYVYNEELFCILHETHLSIGHGRRDRMEYQLNSKYENITRETVMLYLNLCESCQKKGLPVKPITSPNNINLRCQVDLIDTHTSPHANDYKTQWRSIRESYKSNLKKRKLGTSSAAKNKSKYNSLSSLSNIQLHKRKKSNFSVGEEFSSTDMVNFIYSDIQIENFNQTDSTESNEMYPRLALQSTESLLDMSPETNYVSKEEFNKLNGTREGKDKVQEEHKEQLAIMKEMEEAKYNKNNPIQLFFQSMASTVMTFPLELAIEARKRVYDIVSEMELFANAKDKNNE